MFDSAGENIASYQSDKGHGKPKSANLGYRRDAVSDPLSRDPGPEEAVDYLGFSPKTPQRMRVTGERPPVSRCGGR